MRPKSFLVSVALISALLFGIAAFPLGLFLERQLQNALHYTMRTGITRNVQHLGTVLEYHVRHKNISEIRKLLYAHMNDPCIAGVVLYGAQGTILDSIRRTDTGDLLPIPDLLEFRSSLSREVYSINHSLFYDGDLLGRAEVYVSLSPVRQKILPFRKSLLYAFVLFAGLFLSLLLLLLQILLRKPLAEIQEMLSGFLNKNPLALWRHDARGKSGKSEEEFFTELLPPNQELFRRKDELGRLAVTFRQMLAYIHKEFFRQEKNMETLENNNIQLIEELCIYWQQKMAKEKNPENPAEQDPSSSGEEAP
ncbi:MAG TPA: hypothetical protein PK364_00395 [Synergistaceae bacterium]|nr:hypothetical protein [Synergistaceae bacterium]HPJ26969.1 hypothetical protein [Synergistaceae bacterium]HPQ36418.1 hypothetical protein [Synergistaceae bacterium]